MKLRATFILTVAALSSLAGTGALRAADPAPAASAAPVKGFDAFRLVKSRNIFDPDRRGMPSAQSSRPSAPPRANFINLTGTMVAEGRMLAFFSGSRSEYSKVISVGDAIADFKVTGITNTQVELDRAGKQVTVPVGMAVPLEGSSAAVAPPDPTVSDAAAPPDAPNPGEAPPTSTSTSSASKPATAPGGDQNDVLKRMMERRAKELGK
jgi:hypothetical protein